MTRKVLRPSISSVVAAEYEMYVMPIQSLLALDKILPHEVLLSQGLLEPWSRHQDHQVIFVSHQWLGFSHPDPDNEQFDVLKKALAYFLDGHVPTLDEVVMMSNFATREVLELKAFLNSMTAVNWKKTMADVYVWLDYMSMPQPSAAREIEEARTYKTEKSSVKTERTSQASQSSTTADHRHARTIVGATPLFIRCSHMPDCDFEAVKLLVEYNADVNTRCSPDSCRVRTVTSCARAVFTMGCRCRPVRILANVVGATPMHGAARKGDVTTLQVLLRLGALQVRNRMGVLPLDAAKLIYGEEVSPLLVQVLQGDASFLFLHGDVIKQKPAADFERQETQPDDADEFAGGPDAAALSSSSPVLSVTRRYDFCQIGRVEHVGMECEAMKEVWL